MSALLGYALPYPAVDAAPKWLIDFLLAWGGGGSTEMYKDYVTRLAIVSPRWHVLSPATWNVLQRHLVIPNADSEEGVWDICMSEALTCLAFACDLATPVPE